MQVLRPYTLPIKGLKPGLHEYAYKVTGEFFKAFPESPVNRAALELSILVDKKYGELSVQFDFAGTIATDCDRCLANVNLPVSGNDTLLIQFVHDDELESDDPLLIYLPADSHELDLAPFAYEFMLLSLPMIRTFACREGNPPYPCDEEMLAAIEAKSIQSDPTSEDDKGPSPWDVLKNLNK